MDAFVLNVIENTPSIVSGEEGVKDLKVVEAIYKSIALEGRKSCYLILLGSQVFYFTKKAGNSFMFLIWMLR
jgi:hypothetical protein